MKNTPVKWFLTAAIAGLVVVSTAFTNRIATSGDWEVPANYKTMKNPVSASSGSLSNGKALWDMHCKSCHGKYGEGDGPKAANLDTHPGDFTLEEFQGQTDGSLFYKTKFGRDEMPSFEKKIPDDQEIWDIVNYMRELGE